MDWRREVDHALSIWHRIELARRSSDGYSRVGQLTRHGDGWRVDTRKASTLAQAETFIIAEEARGSLNTGIAVAKVYPEGSFWRVEPIPGRLPDAPYLWARSPSSAHQIASMRQELAQLKEPDPGLGLVRKLAEGQAGGTLTNPDDPPPGLNDQQRLAWRACVGDGVWLVWGPPGTGKTTVLRRGLDSLIQSNRRILLVAATNVAVDNMLGDLLAPQHHDHVVRVGQPQVPAVARARTLILETKVDARMRDAVDERDHLRWRNAELEADQIEQDQLVTQISQAQLEILLRARNLLTSTDGDEATAAHRAQQWDAERSRLAQQSQQIEADGQKAQKLLDESAVSAAAWARIDALNHYIVQIHDVQDSVTLSLAEASNTAQRADQQLEALGGWGKTFRRKEIAKAGKHQTEARTRLAEAQDVARATHLRAEAETTNATAEIEQRTSEATVARDECSRRVEEVERLRLAHERTLGALRQVTDHAEQAHLHLQDVRQAVTTVKTAQKNGLSVRADRLQQLLNEADERTLETAQVRQALKTAEERVRSERPAIEREILNSSRVVAMTLSRLRTQAAADLDPFHTVFIDEAGAATLPDIMLAVAQSSMNAVLFGDPRQLGPVYGSSQIENHEDPAVQTWLLKDAFEHCGIKGPDTAVPERGCVALDVQYRFGPAVNRLANIIAYDGLLKTERAERSLDDPEIVLVNTDEMGSLNQVEPVGRRSGWWSAGPLLSRALARMHLSDGDVGIVTPYSGQAELTWEALRDVEGDEPLAEVGTTHRFQGREFDTLIFDTVEGEGDALWMALSQRNGSRWSQEGVRLFNVAVTRSRHRLYVIADGTKLAAAAPGTVFHALQQLRLNQQISEVSGAALLGLEVALHDTPDDLVERIRGALSEHVRISRVDDERTFFPELLKQIDAARSSIHIWAPWIAGRVEHVIPSLEAARDRDVDVVVFARGEKDTLQAKASMLAFLRQLQASRVTVVAIHMMHEKVVVIDRRLVMLGSLNSLSQRHTREVMVSVHGRHFAQRLFEGLRAERFLKPQKCPTCASEDGEFRRWKRGWVWWCIAVADGKRCAGRVFMNF